MPARPEAGRYGEGLRRAAEVMDRLRGPGGCPWDAEQTPASLAPYLLEEAYEAVDAIASGDRAHVREELGDVLLQVLFHARIAEEDPDDPWSVDDVADDLVAKLVRRHPHVFADATVEGAREVETSWESIKAAEKGRRGPYDGLTWSQPALSLAVAVLRRAERTSTGVPPLPDATPAQRYGAELLDLVRRARSDGVDPELALRDAARAVAATAPPEDPA